MLTWNKVIARLVVSTLMLAAVVMALLPVGQVAYGTLEGSREAAQYVQQIDRLPVREEVAQAAMEYNSTLDPEMALQDPWNHEQEAASQAHDAYKAAATGNGVLGPLGRIRVDEVGIDLPIYPDATKESLAKGAGHMYGTSLPVGGKSTHTVIAAHTGWPNWLLFDNITLLEEGDEFVIDSINGSLRYRVDQIAKVRPDDLSLIQIEEGKDYATLVTCFFVSRGHAPYRLLVRGERIPDVPVVTTATQGVDAVGDTAAPVTSPEGVQVTADRGTVAAAAAPASASGTSRSATRP